jgi:hypothetical protein
MTTGSPRLHSAPPHLAQPRRNTITFRSILLGMIGVAAINILLPYNDYVLWNTFLVGNSLPLGAVTLTFLLAVLINGPLSVWAPRHALSAGELGIVMMMLLVGSAIPSSALMRYFTGSLVFPVHAAASNAELAALLERMNLPAWLYPVFQGSSPTEWSRDPVITGYVGTWTGDGAPPYRAWVQPALTWGIYFVGFHGAILCMLTLVRRQWYENERLSFPIAQIQLSLLEPPPPGKWFGGPMRKRTFWLVFLAINLLHALNALSVYQPQYFPEVPVKYNLNSILAEEPWRYMGWFLKSATIYFTAVGVSYLLPGAVSFSMWFFVVGFGVWQMLQGVATGDAATPGVNDQHFGGMLAYAGIVLWIGRHHWMVILRQAVRGEREGEPRGRYLPYAWAFWGMIGFWALMIGWLVAAGSTLGGAIIMTTLLLLIFMLIARVVAETGLLHPGSPMSHTRPWEVMAAYGHGHPVPVQTFWMASHLRMIHNDVRESFAVFAAHGLKVADHTLFDGRPLERQQAADRAIGRKVVAIMALTIVVAFILSYISMIWVEYRFAYEKQMVDAQPVNRHVSQHAPGGNLINPTLNYEKQNYNMVHDPASHMAGGATTTVFLSVMRLRYAWWPLHPIGYLFMMSWPMSQLWFSIFLGWLARTVALRFGGAKLYTAAQPAMMGLIIGEAVASLIWLVLGFVLSSIGMDYHPIRFTVH